MNDESGNILIVDDDPTNLAVLDDCLTSAGYRVLVAESGEAALERIKHIKPDLVILDVKMPGMDGFQTCQILKEDEVSRDIPVIFVTVAHGSSEKIKGFLVGGVDYIAKPFQVEEVLVRVTTHLHIRRLQKDLAEKNRLLLEEINAHKAAEEERRKLESKLQQARKLKSLCVLAGGVAHDFNNLLQGIMGYAGLALAKLPPGAVERHSIEHIEEIAGRAAGLTNQMLAFSGKGAFVVRTLNLGMLVREMIPVVEASISKTTVLQVETSEPIPAIEGDVSQLSQMIVNLVGNASEALEERPGTITLTTGVMECDPVFFADSQFPDDIPGGDYVYLEVADTGCGMDGKTLAEIFDPFFSTRFIGRGLGLAEVSGIVRGHHGAVKIESEPGKGTVLRVFFPASEEAVPQSTDREAPAALWRDTGTVLLVDDEDTVREVVSEMLGKLGFTVLKAADGGEALRIFRENRPAIRLVLLDCTMPGMSGHEVFVEIKKMDKDAKVILSSGYDEKEVIGDHDLDGLAGFIKKPYRLENLSEKFYEVLNPRPKPK